MTQLDRYGLPPPGEKPTADHLVAMGLLNAAEAARAYVNEVFDADCPAPTVMIGRRDTDETSETATLEKTHEGYTFTREIEADEQ